MAHNRDLAGKFTVILEGATHRGLAAEQVLALLDDPNAAIREIHRIHRVCDDGRLELVGVPPDAFRQREALLFFQADVGAARRDYDALLDLAGRNPPPCNIELELAHVRHPARAHVLALKFLSACSESVGQWLASSNFTPGGRVEGGPDALIAYEATHPQVVMRSTLEPT